MEDVIYSSLRQFLQFAGSNKQEGEEHLLLMKIKKEQCFATFH